MAQTFEAMVIASLALDAGVSDREDFEQAFAPLVESWRSFIHLGLPINTRFFSREFIQQTDRSLWISQNFLDLEEEVERILRGEPIAEVLALSLRSKIEPLDAIASQLLVAHAALVAEPSAWIMARFLHSPSEETEENDILRGFRLVAGNTESANLVDVRDVATDSMDQFVAGAIRGFFATGGYISAQEMFKQDLEYFGLAFSELDRIITRLDLARAWRSNLRSSKGAARFNVLRETAVEQLENNEQVNENIVIDRFTKGIDELFGLEEKHHWAFV
jgi:hypothetical protein